MVYPSIAGIYGIMNKVNGKVYVGQSSSIGNRWGVHMYRLSHNSHHCAKLQADWNLYGAIAFTFEILEVVPNAENMNEAERVWFDKYDADDLTYNTQRISNRNGTDDAAFISYINNKWLVPIGVTAKQMEAYRIWRDTDKQDLVDMAVKCKMIAKYPSKITFNRVVHMLENSLGYEVLSKRTIIADAQRTYKLIVSFDEEKKTYAPAIPWESDLWSDD